jgi:hypothetical protein
VRAAALGRRALDGLDADIRAALPPEKLITPDDVRGGATSLRTRCWPRAGPRWPGARPGAVPDGQRRREARRYRQGCPSLDGRVLFTNAVPATPTPPS